MTAFEILLNTFYDTIEQNEPEEDYNSNDGQEKKNELFSLIRKYIDTSFFHGENLRYKNLLSDIKRQTAAMLQGSSHEDWARVKFAFMENELHIIKQGRGKSEVADLKMKLDCIF